jgi:hypothetical protein
MRLPFSRILRKIIKMRGIKILSQLPCLYSLPALVLHYAARDLFDPLNQTHFFELFKKYINKLILILQQNI